jgi:hypothetical protein
MPHQVAVTVRAPVPPGAVEPLKAVLRELADETRRPKFLPFEDMAVHFARFVVLDEVTDLDGSTIAPSVLFMADVDSPAGRFLAELVDLAAEGIDAVFSHCDGYPTMPTAGERLAFVRQHMIRASTNYVNTVGLSIAQIRGEAKLRDAIEAFLDRHAWEGKRASDVRRAVTEFVAGDPTLTWALHRPRRPSLLWRIKDQAHFVGSALLLLAALPFAVIALPFYAIALRIHERSEKPSTPVPDRDHVEQLASMEDIVVQNQFSAVGFVKPGPFRRRTLELVLWLLELSARHVYNDGSLAGIRTIHFARWVFLDDKRRLIFASNYDGSLESYMDDFIDKVAWGLNAAFSNGEGYPRTKWLVLDGAKDERAFKNYLRDHQIETQLWYSAHSELTAVNITRNSAIRRGLRGEMSESEAAEWAALL